MRWIASNPALFINRQVNAAKSHPEERRYLCCFRPCYEILMPLHEILEKGKKQDLTPFMTRIKTSGQRVDILH